MERTTSQCAHWWCWFCQWIDLESERCTKESQNHTSNFMRDRNSSLFVITCRSSEFEVEMFKEALCARTHCYKLCIASNSRTKTATLFPASAVDVIFLIDELVWKLVNDILNTWSDCIFMCFAFISNWVTKVGFCCVMFMSTVVLLGVFSAWITIKYHASI